MSILKDDDGSINWEMIWGICIVLGLLYCVFSGSDEKKSNNIKYEDGDVEIYEKRNGEFHKTDEYNEFDDAIEDRYDYLRDRGRF